MEDVNAKNAIEGKFPAIGCLGFFVLLFFYQGASTKVSVIVSLCVGQ